MYNIFLLGDSIRQNYQNYVKNVLENRGGNVCFPNDNGRSTYHSLRFFHDWWRNLAPVENFDIVHFNCGLWDVLRLSNEKNPITSEEQYCNNLIRLYDRIKYFCPNAKIVFATTTKVIEPGYTYGEKYAKRCNADIVRYNELAVTLFERMGVKVNDLYSISEKLPVEAYSDDVHFETELGIRLLGNQVIKCIGECMDEDQRPNNI